MIEIVLAVGRMLGLGISAGMRPSLTLAVLGVLSHFVPEVVLNGPFRFLAYEGVILFFVIVAMIEAGIDKIAGVDRLQSRLTMPYRLVMGAVASAALMPDVFWQIALGAVVGGVGAWLALYTKQKVRPKQTRSWATMTLISVSEDVAALIVTIVTALVAPFGYVALAAVGVLYGGDRLVRREKYRRLLRHEGDPSALTGQRSATDESRPSGPLPATATSGDDEVSVERAPEA